MTQAFFKKQTISQSMGLTGGGVISLVGAGGKTSLLFRLAAELSETHGRVLTTTTTKMMNPEISECPHVILTEDFGELIQKSEAIFKTSSHVYGAAGRMDKPPHKVIGYAPEILDGLDRSGCFKWILSEADGAARRHLKAPAAHEPVVCRSSKWVIAVAGLDVIGQPLGVEWVYRDQEYSRVSGLKPGEPVTPFSVANAALHPDGFFKGAPENAKKILFLNAAGDEGLVKPGRQVIEKIRLEGNNALISGVMIGSPKEKKPVLEYQALVS